MKRPFAGVAALFATGILAGAYAPLPLPILFALVFATGLAALPAWRGAPPALAVCLVFSGWTHLVGTTAPLSPHDLRLRVHAPEELAVLTGRLQATPDLRRHERAGRLFTNVLAVLEVRTLRLGSDPAPLPTAGKVMVSSPFVPGPPFTAGADVELSGVLRRPRGPQAPGLFDYATFLHWRGIAFELRAGEPADWRLAPDAQPPSPTWSDRFQKWARAVLAHGLNPAEEEVGLLWAMTLGWKTGLTDEVEEPFMKSGTMHVFAISGLHIALIAVIVEQTLRLLFLSRRTSGLVVIAVCWLYTAATGLQPSAVRATLMTTCVILGWILARPSNVLNSLAGAAFGILIWDPRQLFHAGFQLSFAVVGVLGLLAHPIRSWLARLGAPDPMLPAARVPRWRRLWAAAWARASTTLAVAIASWLGSVPLAATHFHLVTISGLLANLIVVPLSSCALAANLAALACAPVSLAPVELFNHTAWFCMHAMIRVSRWAADLPDTCWNVAAPPAASIALVYLLLTATGLGWWLRPRPRTLTLALTFLLTSLTVAAWIANPTRLRLVVLPLSGGHAIWVRSPRQSALIDTGDVASAEHVVLPFLRAQGVNHLDLLALSHGDVRHTGGALEVAERFDPARIVLGPTPFRSTAHRRIVAGLTSGPYRYPKPAPPPHPWRVLHPRPGDSFPRADDACLVLEFDARGVRILLLADLDRQGQNLLLQRHPDLRTDLLILAPPARQGPPLDALLEALKPGQVIVADTALPATARARPPFRDAFDRHSIPTLFTSDTGSLDLRWTRHGLEIRDAMGMRVVPRGIPPRQQRDDGLLDPDAER